MQIDPPHITPTAAPSCPQMLDQRLEQFEQEKKKWEAQKQAAAAEGKTFEDAEPTMDGARERAWQV